MCRMALNEECYVSDDGTMTNSSLLDYRMPTSLDLPKIAAGAMAHAIRDATAVWMDRLPMNPGAVMEASWSK